MDLALRSPKSLTRIRADLRELAGTWPSAWLAAAIGAVYLLGGALTRETSRTARERDERRRRNSMRSA